MSKKTAPKKSPDLNDQLDRLTSIVEFLENDDTTLEESLKVFEEGVKLVRSVQTRLAEAEQRVELLLENDGELITEDFGADEEAK